MKKIIVLLCVALSVMVANAQPSAVKKAANSVFTLTTFDKDGSIKASSRGFFYGADGEAVAPWTPFVGAATAVVVDAKGKKYDVSTMMGVNELYDVCRFRVGGKGVSMRPATKAAKAGAKVWLANNAGGKAAASAMEVVKNEAFMQKYSYYILSGKVADNTLGCPVVDDSGAVLGLLQPSETDGDSHATDVAFLDTVATTGLSLNNPVLRQTGIRVDMPKDKEQAALFLVMAREQSDSLRYVQYVEDFKRLFPTELDGYTALAQVKINAHDYDGAMSEMRDAEKNVQDKAAAHSEWSRLMYQKLVFQPDSTFTKWTFDNALEEARKAYSIDPQPAYKHREAQIVFSQQNYAEAYDMCMELTKTKLRNGELFYEAAQCKTQLKAPAQDIIVLLDSAVAACQQPLTSLAAPYVLSRGHLYDEMGEYRKALKDYLLYDSLMVGRASDVFYYTRYQCEMKLKQYQQALNDIAHAAIINPSQPIYLAELASLQLRVNRFEDAVKAADLCLNIAPENTDSYIIKGLALIQMKKKEEGLQALNKAKELGDSRADALISKYK